MKDVKKMIVIKITKWSRNSVKDFYIILEDWECYDKEGELCVDSIEYYVDERCEKDLSGHSYGWRSEWEIVTDEDVIKKVVNDEIKSINRIIQSNNERIELLKEKFNIIDNVE